MVDDKLGTPTYTIDFARNVELLLSTFLREIVRGDRSHLHRILKSDRTHEMPSEIGSSRPNGPCCRFPTIRVFRGSAGVGAAYHQEARPAKPQHHA